MSDSKIEKLRKLTADSMDYIPRASVQPIVNGHAKILEILKDQPSEIAKIARECLDYAGTLGF